MTTYSISIARRTDSQITAFVTSPAGKQYGLTLSRELITCSCPDAMYRGQGRCKHIPLVVEHLMSELRAALRTGDQLKIEAVRGAWSRAAAWVAVASLAAPSSARRAA